MLANRMCLWCDFVCVSVATDRFVEDDDTGFGQEWSVGKPDVIKEVFKIWLNFHVIERKKNKKTSLEISTYWLTKFNKNSKWINTMF